MSTPIDQQHAPQDALQQQATVNPALLYKTEKRFGNLEKAFIKMELTSEPSNIIQDGYATMLPQRLPIIDEFGIHHGMAEEREVPAFHLGPTSCDILGIVGHDATIARASSRPNTLLARALDLANDRYTYDVAYIDQNQLYRIQSRLTLVNEQNQPGMQFTVHADIAELRDPDQIISITTIRMCDAIRRTVVTPVEMSSLFKGTSINKQEVDRVLLSVIHPGTAHNNNKIFTEAATISYNTATTHTSMVAVYAKLMFYSMMRERFIIDDIQPELPQIGMANTNLIFVNSTAEGNTVMHLQTLATDGYISFYRHRNFPHEFIPMLEMLGYSGRYFTPPEGANKLPAACYSLPAIKIVYFDTVNHDHHAADLDANAIKAFAVWLAHERGEHTDLMDGVMMAIELINSDALVHQDVIVRRAAAQRYRLLDSRWQTYQSPWPTPVDIAWPLTAFCIRHQPQAIPASFASFNAASVNKLIIASVWISEVIRVATSTVLYNLQYTGGIINRYYHNVAPEGFNLAANNGVFQAPWNSAAAPPYVFTMVDELVHGMTSYSLRWPSYKRTWNNNRRWDAGLPLDQGIYQRNWPNSIPRINSVLAINCLLIARPKEWAISTPTPKACINAYFVRMSMHNLPAIYTHVGDKYFQALNNSTDFSISSIFGGALINILAQGPLRHHRPNLTLRYMGAFHDPHALVNWEVIPAADYPRFNWHEPVPIIEPLTMMSYDWHTDRYLAPVLVLGQEALDIIRPLRSQTSTFINGAGVMLEYGFNRPPAPGTMQLTKSRFQPYGAAKPSTTPASTKKPTISGAKAQVAPKTPWKPPAKTKAPTGKIIKKPVAPSAASKFAFRFNSGDQTEPPEGMFLSETADGHFEQLLDDLVLPNNTFDQPDDVAMDPDEPDNAPPDDAAEDSGTFPTPYPPGYKPKPRRPNPEGQKPKPKSKPQQPKPKPQQPKPKPKPKPQPKRGEDDPDDYDSDNTVESAAEEEGDAESSNDDSDRSRYEYYS